MYKRKIEHARINNNYYIYNEDRYVRNQLYGNSVAYKDDYGYRFYKNLNEDVYLTSNQWGDWDITFDSEGEDWVNVNGADSMRNACVIAIMTRLSELDFMPLYTDFGCRVHELIKSNKTKSLLYKIEVYITETLNNMRRVKHVNYVNVTDEIYGELYNYRVDFSVTCREDEEADVLDTNQLVVDGEFMI